MNLKGKIKYFISEKIVSITKRSVSKNLLLKYKDKYQGRDALLLRLPIPKMGFAP